LLKSRFIHRYCFSVVLLAMIIASAAMSGTTVQVLDLAGRGVDPFRTRGAKATVFIFTRTDCPVSNRYAPEVRRLYKRFANAGIVFWLVYADPNESPRAIHQHIKEYDYPFGVLRDPQHALVRLAKIQITPEAAVFISEAEGLRLVYHGRIDNRYVGLGKERPTATSHDLAAALIAILEKRPVPAETAQAVGCYISDLQ
jgi:peroxiredoxin